MDAETFRAAARTMLADARRLVRVQVEPLPDRPITRQQAALAERHGTPAAFAESVMAAMPDVSIKAAVEAIWRYQAQWRAAAPDHREEFYNQGDGTYCAQCGLSPADRREWRSGCAAAVKEEDKVVDREKRFDETIKYPLNPAEWAGVGMELVGQRKVELFRHLPTNTFLLQTRNGERVQHMRLSAEALAAVLTLAFHIPGAPESNSGELMEALRSNGDPSALVDAELHVEPPDGNHLHVLEMEVIVMNLGRPEPEIVRWSRGKEDGGGEETGAEARAGETSREAGYACGGVREEDAEGEVTGEVIKAGTGGDFEPEG